MQNKTKKINKKALIPFIVLSTLSFLTYIGIEIIYNENVFNSTTIFRITLMLLFIICFSAISYKSENKKSIPFIILGSVLIIVYSIFNILNIVKEKKLPEEGYVLNFYNTPITDIYSWQKQNNIDIEEIYEYSDNIPEYHIISQDVSYGTKTKDINKITIVISKGPNYEKEVIVPSFLGWQYDKVITYLEENYLNNIEINYEKAKDSVDTVIFQEGSGTRKRNDLIKLTFSQGEINPTNIVDLKNKSLLYATSWLKKHGFKIEINYEYSDTIKKGYVINQSSIDEVLDPTKDAITLTISKGKMIKVPNLKEMNQEEINKWIMDNNLKVSYQEQYDEQIKLGDIIETNVKENDIIESGSNIEITLSKGQLKMIEVTNLTDFLLWVDQNKLIHEVNYEYSNTIKKDDIIKLSHQKGDIIKEDDTIIITISKGKSIKIPNFVGQSKTNIQNQCNELNLDCSFTYQGYTENTKKDIATKQSKKAGTTVVEGSNIIITLSSGIIEKVTVPSFSGKTKTEINKICQSLGITCKFNYESNYSKTPADTCTKQSIKGQVNKGSTITITLSKGPAKTYTIIIDANQLSNGNPEATKATLQKKLSSACPGVTFKYQFVKANSGIGYLAPTSQVKVGSNSFQQGKTYTVIINSN